MCLGAMRPHYIKDIPHHILKPCIPWLVLNTNHGRHGFHFNANNYVVKLNKDIKNSIVVYFYGPLKVWHCLYFWTNLGSLPVRHSFEHIICPQHSKAWILEIMTDNNEKCCSEEIRGDAFSICLIYRSIINF